MGQKVNPIGFRLGTSKTWQSNWYAEKDYAESLAQDTQIRRYLNEKLKNAFIGSIFIGRADKNLEINIHSARPGLIIGKRGEDANRLNKHLAKMLGQEVRVNIKEIKRPEINASFIAQNLAVQIERRVAFRRAMKKAMQNVQRFKIDGCKIMVSGRLNGAEMARTEWLREGRVPLHTLKANIDYSTCEAQTVYGIIGIKVWTFNESNQNFRKRK